MRLKTIPFLFALLISQSSFLNASEKFPWHQLPRELKWHIMTMADFDSPLCTMIEKMPSQLKCQPVLEIAEDECLDISAISPDGIYYAIGVKESNLLNIHILKVYDLQTKKVIASINIDPARLGIIQCISWHPTERKIACGISSSMHRFSSFMIWDIDSDSQTFKNCQLQLPYYIDWHPTRNELAMAGNNGLYHWDGNQIIQISPEHITRIEWKDGGEKLAYWAHKFATSSGHSIHSCTWDCLQQQEIENQTVPSCSQGTISRSALEIFKPTILIESNNTLKKLSIANALNYPHIKGVITKIAQLTYPALQRHAYTNPPKKTRIHEQIDIDPLKLYLTAEKISQAFEGKIKREESFTQLRPDVYDLVLGGEEHDYYLYLKEQLNDEIDTLKIGLKGRDDTKWCNII